MSFEESREGDHEGVNNTRTETRGASGWFSFIERRWNGSEVESVIRLKGDYTEISGYICEKNGLTC